MRCGCTILQCANLQSHDMTMSLNIQRFWKKRSVTITEYDPTYKVVYLGNVMTAWAKGEGCTDKPLATLWKNYCQSSKADVSMKVTVCNSGLKAVTKEHGLTEYWANRITFCAAHPHYPRIFCWVYRHEGKKLKQELRCHAVLCSKEEYALTMSGKLQQKLTQALQEFRREKLSRQKARLSLANCVYDNPSLPRRKILLSTGTANYRPPLERSKSAPKLGAIEENVVAEEVEETPKSNAHHNSMRGLTSRMQRTRILDDMIDDALGDEEILYEEEEEEEEEEDILDTSLTTSSEPESTSDIVMEEELICNSDHDECLRRGHCDYHNTDGVEDNDDNNNDINDEVVTFIPGNDVVVVMELPDGLKVVDGLTSIDEDGDNISDESGYSEERDFVCKM